MERKAPRIGGRPAMIASLATYVPPRLLTNADLEKMVDTTDEWILQRTGIRERHIVEPGVGTSDLAEPAARAAIDRKSTRLNSSHTEIYTLSLHDALPIYHRRVDSPAHRHPRAAYRRTRRRHVGSRRTGGARGDRSEEHTSELQSHRDLHSFPTRRSSDLPPTSGFSSAPASASGISSNPASARRISPNRRRARR